MVLLIVINSIFFLQFFDHPIIISIMDEKWHGNRQIAFIPSNLWWLFLNLWCIVDIVLFPLSFSIFLVLGKELILMLFQAINPKINIVHLWRFALYYGILSWCMHCKIAEFNNHPSRKFLLLKNCRKKAILKNYNSFAVYGGGVVKKWKWTHKS